MQFNSLSVYPTSVHIVSEWKFYHCKCFVIELSFCFRKSAVTALSAPQPKRTAVECVTEMGSPAKLSKETSITAAAWVRGIRCHNMGYMAMSLSYINWYECLVLPFVTSFCLMSVVWSLFLVDVSLQDLKAVGTGCLHRLMFVCMCVCLCVWSPLHSEITVFMHS